MTEKIEPSPRPTGYWRNPLTWACHAGMFTFGILLAVLGAILPVLLEQVQLDPVRGGSLFLFLSLGSFLTTITSGPIFDRFGYKTILVFCSLVTSSSILVFSQSASYEVMAVSCFLFGFGGGGLNVGTNALVSDLNPGSESAALNRLGLFFGAGTFTIPFLIGILLGSLGLERVLILTAFICFVPCILFALMKFPRAKLAAGYSAASVKRLFKNPFLLLLALLLFFQSGNEITTSGWLTTFLVQNHTVSAAAASLFLSVFWGTLVLGRLSAGWFLKRISPAGLVRLSALFSAVSLASVIYLPTLTGALAAIAFLGFSIAGIYPTVLGQATSPYPGFSGTIIGGLIGFALIGGMLFPWLAGIAVEEYGIRFALLIPLIGFLLVFLVQSAVCLVKIQRMN